MKLNLDFKEEKTLTDNEFGSIVVSKIPKLNSVKLILSSNGLIKIDIPKYINFNQALDYINEKRQWLRRNRNKFIEQKQQKDSVYLPNGFQVSRNHHLEYCPEQDTSTVEGKITENQLKIFYPQSWDLNNQELKDFVRYGIKRLHKREAKLYLPQRLRELAEIHGFTYNKVSLRSAKTRWGSCSSDNNISLNIALMRLPDELIDYVLLHELTHTIHKNHSSAFWDCLSEKLAGNAKAIDKKLKNHNKEYLHAL